MRTLALLVLLGLARGAAGQTPPPTVPAEAPPAAEAPPTPEPPLSPPEQVGVPTLIDLGQGRGPGWLLRVGLQPGWDSNVRLEFPEDDSGSEGAADLVGRASLEVARRWVGPRGELAAALQADGAAYAQQSNLNRAAYGASVRGSHRPSRRTSLQAGGSFGDGYAREISRIVAQGLLLPLVRSRAFGTNAGLGIGLGARTDATLDATYRSIRFEDANIPDGSQLTASARLTRQLGARSEGELSYQHDRESQGTGPGVDARPTVTTHGGFLGVGGSPRPGLQLKASFGLLYSPGEDASRSEISPSGGGSLLVRSRRTRMEASYARVPQLAYGYGRSTISDTARLAYKLDLGRRTAFVCGATYGRSRDPRDPLFRLVSITATAGVVTTFGRGFETGLTYGFGRRDYRDGRTTRLPGDSHAVGLSLAKQLAW